MIKRITFYIALIVLFSQCKTSSVDTTELLQTDFSFMKNMKGKTYSQIVTEKPVLKDYVEFVLSPKIKDQAINILKNESQTLFLHEEMVPTLFTKDGNMAIVEWKGKLFIGFFNEKENKMYEYVDPSLNKPPSYNSFVQNYN